MNRTRRRVAAALLSAAVVAGLSAGCSAGKNAVDQTANTQFRFTNATPKGDVIPVAERRKPGDVSGPLLDGSGDYTLTSDAGKVVVVNLWGSWCSPCQVETPEFEQVFQQTEADGVDFVGFAVKETGESGPRNFVSDNGITYPVVYDPATKVALQLGKLPVQGIPLTALIDKQGRVAAAYVGIVQPSQLKPALATLVAEN